MGVEISFETVYKSRLVQINVVPSDSPDQIRDSPAAVATGSGGGGVGSVLTFVKDIDESGVLFFPTAVATEIHALEMNAINTPASVRQQFVRIFWFIAFN
jgi:hypothetical protein